LILDLKDLKIHAKSTLSDTILLLKRTRQAPLQYPNGEAKVRSAMKAFKPGASRLPESVMNLIQRGVELLAPESIVLFGSRARGDHRENSDFDIAFKGINRSDEWTRFTSLYRDEPITLHKVDLIIYESSSPEYRRNIDRDGVVLFER
jgi:uncharacterized protein